MFIVSFDCGDEIKLDSIEKVLNKAAHLFEIKMEKSTPKHFKINLRFLKVKLGKKKIEDFEANIVAKIYHTGTITIILEIPFSIKSLEDLIDIQSKIYENCIKTAKEIKKKITDGIKEEILDFREGDFEEYILIFLNKVENPITFIKNNRLTIGKVLEMDKEVSTETCKRILSKRLQYYENEVIIFNWFSSLLINIEENEIEEVSTIFEIATLQLLEIKAYDKELEDLLKESLKYIKIDWKNSFISNVSMEIKRIVEERIEIQRIVESIINLGKFFGEWYYAKIYERISSELHLHRWESVVLRKIEYLEKIYESIEHRINEYRMVILELLIVLLFVVDIIFILFKI